MVSGLCAHQPSLHTLPLSFFLNAATSLHPSHCPSSGLSRHPVTRLSQTFLPLCSICPSWAVRPNLATLVFDLFVDFVSFT